MGTAAVVVRFTVFGDADADLVTGQPDGILVELAVRGVDTPAGGQVELPQVPRAGEYGSVQLTVGQWVLRVRADALVGADLAARQVRQEDDVRADRDLRDVPFP